MLHFHPLIKTGELRHMKHVMQKFMHHIYSVPRTELPCVLEGQLFRIHATHRAQSTGILFVPGIFPFVKCIKSRGI